MAISCFHLISSFVVTKYEMLEVENNNQVRVCKSAFFLSQFAEEYERAEKLVAQKSNEAR